MNTISTSLSLLQVNPNLESFPADAFLDLGSLEELHLSNNPGLLGGQLSLAQITLNSPNFKYLYLSNDAISNIEVDAITGEYLYDHNSRYPGHVTIINTLQCMKNGHIVVPSC